MSTNQHGSEFSDWGECRRCDCESFAPEPPEGSTCETRGCGHKRKEHVPPR